MARSKKIVKIHTRPEGDAPEGTPHWCDVHKFNKTHDTAQCFDLNPPEGPSKKQIKTQAFISKNKLDMQKYKAAEAWARACGGGGRGVTKSTNSNNSRRTQKRKVKGITDALEKTDLNGKGKARDRDGDEDMGEDGKPKTR